MMMMMMMMMMMIFEIALFSISWTSLHPY